MWDELKKNDVVEVVKGNVNDKNKITQALLEKTLGVVAEKQRNHYC